MENRMDSKLDVLNYKQMDGLRVFLNTLDYRTPHFHNGAVQLGGGPRAAQKDEKLYHALLSRGPFPSVGGGIGI